MESETYPDEGVQGYIKGNSVWVEFNALEQPEVAERFECCWTPTILFEGAEGREHGRSEGYSTPSASSAKRPWPGSKTRSTVEGPRRSQPTTQEKL